jgi:adenine C2-methylase RlmN of 23S rRNA A2503 and tRNA A37
MDQLFSAQEEHKKAEEKGKPKSRTQQVINMRAKEGDEAFDDETSLGSVAADVLEQEQIARNLKALQREIDNKWGKGTFKKIEVERSKRIAEKHKKKREAQAEAQRRAEEEEFFWKKIALETVKAISVIAFIGGGIYLLVYLKDMQ